ncbi:helix-turn-helix domain-containing protein [Paenibacillus artemisiicola]|uniref:helix-turn-helix domain-containing protein n=1 Tax=Paenibacillus artemisiicola TaxID=1172618 RepID=UPI001F0B40A8|nr:helix-turn-helix domain-containing protein [Paenibacillus artemisiicola]
MAKKERQYQTYSFETKKKAIELRLQGMTKQKVAEVLGIADVGRLKVWMRRYIQMGDFGLTDTRGKRKDYANENSYVRRLEMENAVLKKWLAITKAEVYQKSVGSSKSSESISPLQNFVKKSDYPEADSTPF